MKLKKFIQKLKKIAKEQGDDIKVIMADNISVSSPVFSKRYPNKKSVIITDNR